MLHKQAKLQSSLINESLDIANLLLKKEPIQGECLKDIPKTQGVYLIYDIKKAVIYVGKGKDLLKRIQSDHISSAKRATTSIFRRKLNKKFNISYGSEMRDWIKRNCYFSWVEIEDKDQTSLIESMLIFYLRKKKKSPLLND